MQGVISTILIGAGIVVIVFFIVRGMYKNVKNGRGLDGGCSGNCARCGSHCKTGNGPDASSGKNAKS